MPTILQSETGGLHFFVPEREPEPERVTLPRDDRFAISPSGGGLPSSPRLSLRPVVVLFDGVAIRDTVSHFPTALLDLANAKLWGLEIDNQLDQNLTVELIGSLTNRPDSAGDVGINQVSTLGTFEPIATENWMPFLGVRLIASTAPTTGLVTVRGQVQVEV